MKEITLKGSSDIGQRIELLSMLFSKAEEKVRHSDTFRQRNMNYSLVTFGAFMALGIRFDPFISRGILSGTLFVLMVIFCSWDRRWHKTKHGWDYSSRVYFQKMQEMVNDPDQDISFKLYYLEGEQSAEGSSFQPLVFYFLIVASVISFFLFSSLKTTAP